jgi:antirestriction protein ArdC
MARTTTAKRDVAAEVTQMFIASLEKGRVPWHKPWQATGGVPRSLSTGRPYRGTNSMLLGISSFDREYESPWWGTYRQIAEMGGQVKKGEKGTEVILYKPIEKEDDTSEVDGGKKSRGMLLRSFTVFNASQCTGLPEKYMKVEEDTRSDVERIAQADSVVEKYLASDGPKLNHDGGDRAFYSPSLDRVAMPALNSFLSPEGYYSTL